MAQINCSFCGRNKKDVDLMISGLHAHICNFCIEQSYQIQKEESKVEKSTKKKAFTLLKPKEIKEIVLDEETAKVIVNLGNGEK